MEIDPNYVEVTHGTSIVLLALAALVIGYSLGDRAAKGEIRFMTILGAALALGFPAALVLISEQFGSWLMGVLVTVVCWFATLTVIFWVDRKIDRWKAPRS